jgi:hypothetical protein
MPSALVIEADQRFLSDGLDRASVIVHGRNSHENQPQSPQRRRLIATRKIESIAPAPDPPQALLGGRGPLAFGMEGAAILGATENLGLFLPRYDVFHLSRVAGLHLSGGRPVFPQVPQRGVEAVLASSKLTPSSATAVRFSAWAHIIYLVPPERPGCCCLRIEFHSWPIAKSPAEAHIISRAVGKRRAFAFDRREMLRRENAAYDLRAGGCQIRVPGPNTCRPARLTRATRRGFGRRNRSQ